ncbi:(dimethylallyl)adenosine tRNA methylthiotransferase [Thermoplasmatales archaeon]|nr:(dimethylallyl)adenosine tRNA methylthiotransferase [Thermoplasmatales archaeon]
MKIYSESYGCTQSRSETGLYVNSMLAEGNTLVSRPEEADMSIIGTCVVIKQTEDRMIRRIEEISRVSRVRVMGCLSTMNGGSLAQGNIEVLNSRDFRSFYSGRLDDIEIREPSIFEGIPINQGCTGSCNFCISHIARGKLLSRPPEKIRNQVLMQLEKGIREVRISSLDTAAYGKDIGVRLNDLVDAITSINDRFMLRVGMMEPRNTMEILPQLVDSYRNNKVFKFLHLPVQSGDDRILELMNREYRAEAFTRIVDEFRKNFPDMVISTDIISGYHGDDEQSFDATCRLIEAVKPDIINITRFSPRPFTRDYSSAVPPSNAVKRWTRVYTDMHREITQAKLISHIGKLSRVIITETGKDGTVVGRDTSYRPVVIHGKFEKYSVMDAEVVDAAETYLIGKPVFTEDHQLQLSHPSRSSLSS